jgi:hypothetical protein
MDMSFSRFFVFQEVALMLPVFPSAECMELPFDFQRSRRSQQTDSNNLRVTASAEEETVGVPSLSFRMVSGAVLGQVPLSGSENSPFLCHRKNPLASEDTKGFDFLPTQISTL